MLKSSLSHALPSDRRSLSARGAAAALLAVAFIVFARRPDLLARPQFWAEDGRILFFQARLAGWATLAVPYPAYPILVQRFIAFLVNDLPARWAPAAYAYSALAVLLASAWFCLRGRLDRLIDARGRVALALALVLVPNNGEVFLSVIGSQWVLAPVLWILILQDAPGSRMQAAVDFAGLILAGLTGPFMVLFAPWFALRWRRTTGGFSPYNIALVSVAWMLCLVQIHFLARGGTPHAPLNTEPARWMKELGFRLPGELFFGAVVPHYLGKAFWVISPLLLATLGWALRQAQRERLLAAVVVLGSGLAAYGGGIIVSAPLLDGMSAFGGDSRYFYLFYLAAMWTAIFLFFDPAPRLRPAALIALAAMLLSSASMFSSGPLVNQHWDKYARKIDAHEFPVVVPINPPGWEVEIDQ